jgi:hypothetical protein
LELTMLRVLVAASVTCRAAAAETWIELGTGGCRAPGGGYDKRKSEKALGDVECRRACEEDDECTATVFGAKGSRTICHLLGGGPYTHADGRSNFTCSTRSVQCTLPEESDGYDFSACNLPYQPSELPPCQVECAPGYSGDPVVRCLGAGSTFSLDGCAELSTKWALHGAGSCSSLGGPRPFVSVSAVSRSACQARCQEDRRCLAITYDALTNGCELALETPPAYHGGIVSNHKPECWRLGPPSVSRGPDYHETGRGYHVKEVDTDVNDDADVVVSVTIVLGVLLLTASLTLTHFLRVRLLERVSRGEQVNPPSLLTRLVCGPCALYYWEGSDVPTSRYAASWCCWRPSKYVVQDRRSATAHVSNAHRTPVQAFAEKPEKVARQAKSGGGAVSPERPCSKGSSRGSSCSTRASTPGQYPSTPIGRVTDPGPPSDSISPSLRSHSRVQVRGEAPPLPPLTHLPTPP